MAERGRPVYDGTAGSPLPEEYGSFDEPAGRRNGSARPDAVDGVPGKAVASSPPGPPPPGPVGTSFPGPEARYPQGQYPPARQPESRRSDVRPMVLAPSNRRITRTEATVNVMPAMAPAGLPTVGGLAPPYEGNGLPMGGEAVGERRRWRRTKVRVVHTTSSRRLVRRIDTWTVFKVSLVFYLLGLAIFLVAGVILWHVASDFGTITSLDKSVRSLFSLRNFKVRPIPLLEYTAAGGGLLAFLGTLLNTAAALIYNLISDVVGGVQVVVLSEPD